MQQEDDLTDGVAVFTEAGFFPDAVGWPYTWPDGVVTKICFRQTPSGPQSERGPWQTEMWKFFQCLSYVLQHSGSLRSL